MNVNNKKMIMELIKGYSNTYKSIKNNILDNDINNKLLNIEENIDNVDRSKEPLSVVINDNENTSKYKIDSNIIEKISKDTFEVNNKLKHFSSNKSEGSSSLSRNYNCNYSNTNSSNSNNSNISIKNKNNSSYKFNDNSYKFNNNNNNNINLTDNNLEYNTELEAYYDIEKDYTNNNSYSCQNISKFMMKLMYNNEDKISNIDSILINKLKGIRLSTNLDNMESEIISDKTINNQDNSEFNMTNEYNNEETIKDNFKKSNDSVFCKDSNTPNSHNISNIDKVKTPPVLLLSKESKSKDYCESANKKLVNTTNLDDFNLLESLKSKNNEIIKKKKKMILEAIKIDTINKNSLQYNVKESNVLSNISNNIEKKEDNNNNNNKNQLIKENTPIINLNKEVRNELYNSIYEDNKKQSSLNNNNNNNNNIKLANNNLSLNYSLNNANKKIQLTISEKNKLDIEKIIEDEMSKGNITQDVELTVVSNTNEYTNQMDKEEQDKKGAEVKNIVVINNKSKINILLS